MSLNYCVPTGVIIKEYLEEKNITQKELSHRLGMSEKHISNLLNGNIRVTEDVALKLEKIITDIPASYWLNLEAKYREFLARQEEENILIDNLEDIARKFHFKDVFKNTKMTLIEQANKMLKILKISSFNNFNNTYENLNINFMKDGGEIEAIAIWLGLCEGDIEIQNLDLNDISFSKKELESNLYKFKDIAYNDNIQNSLNSCRKLCNKLGIYLVIEDAIPNCKVRGALTTYKGNPAIYLSGRFKTHDHIWFAFLHELGHLLKHYRTKETMISFEDGEENIIEEEANCFARDFLVEAKDYKQFIEKSNFSSSEIEKFASQQNVLPGIVVARLQHDKYMGMDKFNYKKSK